MSFTDQCNDLWRTRPIRLPQAGPGAGVAAGIAYRYDIDVILVRVAFVVGTIFGGAGLVLYLAGWLLFNQPGDRVSAAESLFGKGRSSQSPRKTVLVGVALVIALSAMGPVNIGVRGTGLISMALMLGGWWLLYLRHPDPPPAPEGSEWGWGLNFTRGPVTPAAPPSVTPPASTTTDSPPRPDRTVPVDRSAEPTTEPAAESARPDTAAPTDAGTATDSMQPPSWDPLGVAPFAWDLPEPTAALPVEAEAEPPARRPRATSVVLGTALLVAAGAGTAAALGVGWLTPARIGAMALAIVGFGLVAGAFRRAGFGLVLIAFPLIGFVVLASLLNPLHIERISTGEHTWAPTAAGELRDSYRINFGSGTLDLRGLKLTAERTVKLDVTAGQFKVLLPASMNARTSCTADVAGQCPTEGAVPGGDRSAPRLNLDVNVRAGQVEVHHD